MADDSKKAAVYVPWTTFKNAIEQLSQGVPNVIDRTVFPGFSGGVQSQLFAGMRFLGLIDDDSRPLPKLHELAASNESVRKAKLKETLAESYSEIFALDLMKATPGQVLEQMRSSYQVSGGTAERAVRFFLSAVSYAGIPVSPLLQGSRAKNDGNTTGGVAVRRRRTKPKSPADDQHPIITPESTGESRTVVLRSGGTLTISASTGWLSLSTEDRDFVFDLIDKLAAYEKRSAESSNTGKWPTQ